MAILFYDDISLDKQEIRNVSLEKMDSTAYAAMTAFQGRIIYNDETNFVEYYNGSSWVVLDGTGNIDSVTGGTGLYNVGGNTTGAITLAVDYLGVDNIVLSAETDGAALSTASLILASVGDDAKAYTLGDLKTTINAGVSSITANNSTYINVGASPSSGAVGLTANLSATGAADGKYLRGDNTWQTPEANSNTVYDISTSSVTNGGKIKLNASSGTDSYVSFVGVPGETSVTESGSTITFGLATNIVFPGSLNVLGDTTYTGDLAVGGDLSVAAGITVTGAATFETIPTVPTGTPTSLNSAVSKGYVDGLVSGGLVFRGSYDAATVASGTDLNPCNLEDSTNADAGTNILVGYTYVVTTGGAGEEADGTAFFNPVLKEGDLIICKTSPPTTAAHWVAVEKNATFATATVAGLAMFASGNGFAAPTGSGDIALATQTAYTGAGSATQIPQITTDTYGAVTDITEVDIQIATTQITNFTTNVNTEIGNYSHSETITGNGATFEFTVDHLIPTAAHVTVQVYDNTTGATVYPKITRDGQNVIVTFKSPPPVSPTYQVLILGSVV